MAGVIAIAVACGLAADAHLLAAIVSIESGGNPIALQVNGAMELVRQPRDRKEAAAFATWLLAHRYNFDAGLAQVNSANFARLGLDATSVFAPEVQPGTSCRWRHKTPGVLPRDPPRRDPNGRCKANRSKG